MSCDRFVAVTADAPLDSHATKALGFVCRPAPMWPTTAAQWVLIVAAFLVGAVLTRQAFRVCSPRWPAPPSAGETYAEKKVEWERDRVMSAAKGLAATSAGFLTAVLTALLKDEIAATVSTLAVVGCLGGAVGGLLIALRLTKDAAGYP